jgi:hypothetical protein
MLHSRAIPSVALRAAKRILILTIVVAATYVLVLFATASLGTLDEFSGMTLGSESAATHHATLTSTRAASTPPRAQPQDREQQRGLDYFPDHYHNQATEPAEPIATF